MNTLYKRMDQAMKVQTKTHFIALTTHQNYHHQYCLLLMNQFNLTTKMSSFIGAYYGLAQKLVSLCVCACVSF